MGRSVGVLGMRSDRYDLIGATAVAIYHKNCKPGAAGKQYCFLSSGDWFDLAGLRKIASY